MKNLEINKIDDRSIKINKGPFKDSPDLYANIIFVPKKVTGTKKRAALSIVGLSKGEYKQLKELMNK